jgi:hypothetical protein
MKVNLMIFKYVVIKGFINSYPEEHSRQTDIIYLHDPCFL